MQNITIKTKYIDKDVFHRINYNSIIDAPTGTGKSQTTIETISKIEYKREFVIVVPTIQLVKEYEEKFLKLGQNARAIYSKQEYLGSRDYITVSRQLVNAWKDKECRIIILTYSTFNKNVNDFTHDKERFIIFDEAHKLLNYFEIVNKIEQGFLHNYKLVTATSETLKAIFKNVNFVRIRSTVKSYDRTIEVYDTTEHNLSRREKKALFLLEKQKEYKKLVVHYNNKKNAEVIKELLEAEGLKVHLYNANKKQIKILDENIQELNGSDWDIIICTSSLTEGVSFRNEVYSIFIVTPQDTAENIPQFLARNRNEITKGAILCRLQEKPTFKNTIFTLKQKADFIDRTALNLNILETALKYSRDTINKFCSMDLLEKLLKSSDAKVIRKNCLEFEEEEEEEEKKKLKPPKEKVVRSKWINKQYIKSSFWDTATKLLKIYETEVPIEVETIAQKEVMSKNIFTPKEREYCFRAEFWDFVITERKQFKMLVKRLIRTKYSEDFKNVTDNEKLIKIAKGMIKEGEIKGKKDFYNKLMYLLENTLANAVVKKDIEFLLSEFGYTVKVRREKQARFYSLVSE